MILDKEDTDGLFVLEAPTYAELLADLQRVVQERNQLLEASKYAVPLLEAWVDDFGPCDHDVNICVCHDKNAIEQAKAAIANVKDNLA